MFEITLYFFIGFIVALAVLFFMIVSTDEFTGFDLFIVLVAWLVWPLLLVILLAFAVKFIFSEDFVIYRKKEKKK